MLTHNFFSLSLFAFPFSLFLLLDTDGKRCADTIQSLFTNAANPDDIIVGVIEQNDPNDRFCLEEYCSRMGVEKHYTRETIRKDVVKIIAEPERLQCPRFDQIRHLAFHDKTAKGPLYARSMTRKILGNEEFCMQVDAHSSFRKNWDQIAKNDWKSVNNEFAVLSHVPAKQADEIELSDGASQESVVPRQCKVAFQDNGVPVSIVLLVRIAAVVLGDTAIVSLFFSISFSFFLLVICESHKTIIVVKLSLSYRITLLLGMAKPSICKSLYYR